MTTNFKVQNISDEAREACAESLEKMAELLRSGAPYRTGGMKFSHVANEGLQLIADIVLYPKGTDMRKIDAEMEKKLKEDLAKKMGRSS